MRISQDPIKSLKRKQGLKIIKENAGVKLASKSVH